MEILVLGLVALLGWLVWVYLKKGSSSSDELQTSEAPIAYNKKQTLLSPAERSFYGVLCQAVGENYQVHVKVRLNDLIQPASGLSRSDWRTALNHIDRKHVDFVLTHPGTFEVVCAIELDDSSHEGHKRKQRDTFIDAAAKSAGLRLVHVPARGAYTVHEVRDMLGLGSTPQPLPNPIQSNP